MVQLPQQPHVYRRPDLPAFDGISWLDRAFCGALRVARTLGDEYATEGMDLENSSFSSLFTKVQPIDWTTIVNGPVSSTFVKVTSLP